jgi:hypothetical protein
MGSGQTPEAAAAEVVQRGKREANIRAAEARGIRTGGVGTGVGVGAGTPVRPRSAADEMRDRMTAARVEGYYASMLAYQERETRRLAIATDSLAIAKREVTRTQEALNDTQQAWNGLSQEVAQGLDRFYNHNSPKYRAALQAIDDATGSTMAKQWDHEQAVAKLNKDLVNGKINLEQYGKGVADLGKAEGLSPMDTVIEAANAAIARVGAIQAELNGMKDKVVTIWVRTLPYVENKWGAMHTQFGMDAIIPPGFNENFPILATSGERVTVQTPGQQSSPRGGKGQTFNIAVGNEIDERALVEKIARISGRS